MSYSPRAAAVERTRQKRLKVVRDYRNARGCGRCPERDPRCLDLHHRDPATKHPALASRGNGSRGWAALSFKDIEAELEKCEVLCSNCHRKLATT